MSVITPPPHADRCEYVQLINLAYSGLTFFILNASAKVFFPEIPESVIQLSA